MTETNKAGGGRVPERPRQTNVSSGKTAEEALSKAAGGRMPARRRGPAGSKVPGRG